MRLVYLSPLPWSSFAQRPHKFVEWFHSVTSGNVLWIDPYPTRFPRLTDFRRLGAQTTQENFSRPSWIKVIQPFTLPIEPLPWSGRINTLMWSKTFDEIDVFSYQEPPLLVTGKPSVLALTVMKRLNNVVSVYDAMDDFPSFYNGISRIAMRYRESELITRVTRVLASSSALKQRWSNMRADVQLVRNGLDANALPASKTNTPVREKKVLGYIGTIASWFDWEWVVNLAKKRPLDVVRLVGPMFIPSPHTLPPNVEIFPACTHQDALRAMLEFDVGLIPFKKNKLTSSVDPIKYYEYRALGLPVLSTNFGEMAMREGVDGTFLSYGLEDADHLVRRALLYSADAELTRRFIADNTWDARFSAAKII